MNETEKLPTMNVREIVDQWLRENEYDGLCTLNCGCPLDDLMPCGKPEAECRPGYNNVDGDGEFQIGPEKQKGDKNARV
jgi:hypothetical protein